MYAQKRKRFPFHYHSSNPNFTTLYSYKSFAQGVLGDVLYKKENYHEAAKVYRRALRSYERHYYATKGPPELELLGAMQLIGTLYMNAEQYEEAIKAFSSSLNVSMTVGPATKVYIVYIYLYSV